MANFNYLFEHARFQARFGIHRFEPSVLFF